MTKIRLKQNQVAGRGAVQIGHSGGDVQIAADVCGLLSHLLTTIIAAGGLKFTFDLAKEWMRIQGSKKLKARIDDVEIEIQGPKNQDEALKTLERLRDIYVTQENKKKAPKIILSE